MLSLAERNGYHDRGFVSPLAGYSIEEAQNLLRSFEALEAEFGGAGALQGTTRQYRPHLYLPWAADLVRHPPILDAVESLIGPDILVYHLTIWVKEAGSTSYISWHQDSTYFGLQPFEHVTAWLALTDANEEMGCMRVALGSHKLGELAPSENRDDPSLLLREGQVIHVDEEALDIEPMPLLAGQFSLHHTLALHCSGPNKSAQRRVGFGISYIPARCRCIAAQPVNATLVRGEDPFGHFKLEPSPQAVSRDENLQCHEESLRRWNAMRAEVRASANNDALI
jgi:non-heme Fe2+,alpha-ketoglutarate-dependent halogenase